MKRGRKRVTTNVRYQNFRAWLRDKKPGNPDTIARRFLSELKAHAAGLARLARE